MTWELAAAAIAPWLGEWVTTKIAEAVLGGVSGRLKPEDLGKALKTCAAAADKQVRLFYNCYPRFVPPFLDHVFKDLAIEELQRPLKEEGTPPRVDFLVKAFQEALQDHPKVKQDIDTSLIKPWLEVFARTYFESTKTYLNFQVVKDNYFKRLEDWFDDIKFAGIKVEGREVEKSAKLADIFVMPDVVEEGQRQDFAPFERDFKLEENVSQRQAELLWEQRQLSRLGDGAGRTFLAQQLLSESTAQKLVLLGAPGSGKTTLMSYFTVMLAREQPQQLGLAADTDWLPILIRIRDLSRYSDISILEYVQQFARTNLSVNQLPTGFFEYWLDDGRALILLDGLDEVAESGKRDEIIRKIECFLGQFDKNRAIITSRPAGYKPVFFRTQELPHYTLQLFDESKVELFVKYWYESRFKDIEEAQRRGESLKKALTGQEGIKVLAKNPLLLTIISLIHRYEADLPRQRYKLYDRAVKTLLTAWDAGKELDYQLPLDYLNRDDIERLMQRLAYWIHTQGGTGDKQGGTLIDKDELIRQLRKFIVEQKGIERHQAEAEAKRFIGYIRERCGLLNEQGQDCYAFVHKTFQEYLAAEEIRYRQEDEDFEVVLEHIQNYLHDAHWQEVLLLLIAQQKPKKATKALEAILQQPTPYQQWLHRNLFFAGKCLAEDLAVSDGSLVAEILHQLVVLEVSHPKKVGYKIRAQVFQTLCSLDESRFEKQALHLLKESADRIYKVRLQEYRAALGEKEEAIATLLEMLKHKYDWVRSGAANALGNSGKASEQVIAALLERLKDQNDWVRSGAAEALGNSGKASEQVIAALLERLKDEDGSVRSRAAYALGDLGKASEQVIAALLERLKDQNDWVRSGAAYALGNSGKASEQVIAALLERLKDKNGSVRSRAAYALGDLGKASEQVIAALLERLKDQNDWVCSCAAYPLGKLGKASEQVIAALLELLKDQDGSVRSRAADALGKLGKNSSDVATAVAQRISQHPDSNNVGRYIDVLWDVVAGESSV
jgi:HEAT repeat protein/energy-coupling factor transporter ATP-binding protein EcfA2